MSDSHLLREVFRGENGLRSRLPKGQNGGQRFEKGLKRDHAIAAPKGPQATSSNDGAQGRGAEKVSRSEGDRSAPEAARRLDSSKAGKGPGQGCHGLPLAYIERSPAAKPFRSDTCGQLIGNFCCGLVGFPTGSLNVKVPS